MNYSIKLANERKGSGAMKLRKWETMMIAGLTAFAVLVGGCGGSKDKAASSDGAYQGKVTLGCTTWIGYAPLHLAVEKGFAKEEGVDLEIRTIESAGDLKNAMKAGQLQGMEQTIDTEVMAKSGGIDLVMVQPLCNSNGGDGIVAKKEYKTLSDLKGKTIALDTTGGASLFWFNTLLDAQGLSMKDFDIKNMSAGDAGSSFVGGKVDAAVTWEPWLSKAKATDFGSVMTTSKESPGVIVDALCFSKDFATKNPNTVKGIIRAYFKALKFIKENPDEAIPILAKSQGMTPEEFKEQMPNIQYFDEAMTKDYMVSGKMAEMAQKASDLWIKLKLMETPVKGTDIVDSSYFEGL